MENTGFETYKIYSSLKLHFESPSYSVIKYNWKTNVSQNTFLTRKDKFHFYRLSRKYSIDELKNYLVANFVYGDSKWVGDMIGPDGEECYRKWQKNNQSITYIFENNVDTLMNEISRPDEWLRVSSGQYPELLKEVMQGTIAIETLVIMNDIMGFFDMWKKKISDDIIFPKVIMKYEKYAPFVVYDKMKFKNILKEKILENA
jgi:hypothetical protein